MNLFMNSSNSNKILKRLFYLFFKYKIFFVIFLFGFLSGYLIKHNDVACKSGQHWDYVNKLSTPLQRQRELVTPINKTTAESLMLLKKCKDMFSDNFKSMDQVSKKGVIVSDDGVQYDVIVSGDGGKDDVIVSGDGGKDGDVNDDGGSVNNKVGSDKIGDDNIGDIEDSINDDGDVMMTKMRKPINTNHNNVNKIQHGKFNKLQTNINKNINFKSKKINNKKNKIRKRSKNIKINNHITSNPNNNILITNIPNKDNFITNIPNSNTNHTAISSLISTPSSYHPHQDDNKFHNYIPQGGVLPDAMYWRKMAALRKLHSLPISAIRKPVLLCWLMTDLDRLSSLQAAQKTWFTRCDLPLVFTTEKATNFPSILVPDVLPGRNNIASKSRKIWSYIYEKYSNKADFFLKSDPDSFVMVDVLKRYLQTKDPSEAIFMGHSLFMDMSSIPIYGNFKGMYSAGAGLLLSRGALLKMGPKINMCPWMNGKAEDLKTSICLKEAGVYLTDTRDLQGREVFLPPFNLQLLSNGLLPRWYRTQYRKHMSVCESIKCLSALPTVFHYVKAKEMFIINFLARTIYLLLEMVPNDRMKAEGFFMINGTLFNSTF